MLESDGDSFKIYVTRHNKTGHLSLTKKIVIFHSSERAFHQLKDNTSHVQMGFSIAILWSKIDLNFFLFSLFFLMQMD